MGWQHLALAGITLAGLALRLYRLGDASVWWDEGWSVWLARMSLAGAALRTAYDTNPPLYYWLLHLWRLAAGEGEYAIRFLSLLPGVALIPVMYRLGRRLESRLAGLLAAALVAISPFMITWSQQARMYSLLALLGAASTDLALRLWQRGRWRDWLAYVGCALAMLLTHNLAALFLLVQNGLWLLNLWRGERKEVWRWPLAQGALVAGMVPWLMVFLPRMPTWSVAEPIHLWPFLYNYWGASVRGSTVHIEQSALLLAVSGLALLASACAYVLAPSKGEDRRRLAPPFAALAPPFAALAPPLAVFLLSQPRHFFYAPKPEPRYLSAFAPLLYLFWAGGLASAWSWLKGRLRVIAVLLLGVSLGSLASSLPGLYAGRYITDDYLSLACTLRTYVQPDDLVLLHTDSDWPVFAYHYAGAWQGVPNSVAWNDQSASNYLHQFLPGRRVVWLVLTPDALRADPKHSIEGAVEAWCGVTDCIRDRWDFGTRSLIRLAEGTPLPRPALIAARLRTGLSSLNGAWWPYGRGRSGDQWQAYLWWQGTGAAPSLALVSGGSTVVTAPPSAEPAQAGGLVRLSYRLALPEPGRYRVVVIAGERALSLTELRVGPAPSPGPAVSNTGRQPIQATFGDVAALEGYALEPGSLKPGGQLCVTLFWRASGPAPRPYTVFVHLLGTTYNARQNNFLWGQHDGQPAQGDRPMTGWRAGEEVADRHCLRVNAQAPSGDYAIEVGLYDPSSGQRLPVTAGGQGDRIILVRLPLAR